MGERIEALIAQTERWLSFHRSRGKQGQIEAAACAIRLRALRDCLTITRRTQ
jgi:hypothetical protein